MDINITIELIRIARDLTALEEIPKILQKLPSLKIYEIAEVIKRVWGQNINYAAKPYLSAMMSMNSVRDNYGQDDGRSIIAYFLSNASTFRGNEAKLIKAELNKRLKRG